jgi:hypothetical protein
MLESKFHRLPTPSPSRLIFLLKAQMNISKIVITATLVAATGAAFAEASYPPEVSFVSSKTRAGVIAELKQESDEDGLNYAASAPPVLQPAASTKTRAAVKATLNADATIANRELDVLRINVGH